MTEVSGPVPLGPVKAFPIGTVRPSADNPRKIPQSAIDVVAKSIGEFGWQQPIVVDAEHVVIAGHTRLLAAKKLRLATVPVVVAKHLSPEQVRAYRIADNRSGDFTSWDFTELTAQLDELAEDFSDVLALANWQAIVADYDAQLAATADPATADRPAPVMDSTRSDAGGDLNDDPDDPDEDDAPAPAAVPERPTDDPIAAYLSNEFQINVVCDNEHTARVVAAAVIDMPGVIDVRDKR